VADAAYSARRNQLIKRAAYLDKVADQTIEATHRIASSLRPAVLDFGIVSAIEWQLKRFRQNTDIACELSAPDEAIPLGPDADITVFRIVQEALTNVAKHAHATRVKVTLAREPDELQVTVTDNGLGIQPAQIKNGEQGVSACSACASAPPRWAANSASSQPNAAAPRSACASRCPPLRPRRQNDGIIVQTTKQRLLWL
jgi:signal transduction histidine kinase